MKLLSVDVLSFAEIAVDVLADAEPSVVVVLDPETKGLETRDLVGLEELMVDDCFYRSFLLNALVSLATAGAPLL